MSFLLPCPNCGPRDVNEFVYAGEITERPGGPPSARTLNTYVYFRRNAAGPQREWWYHRLGCEAWLLAERDTRTNAVLSTRLPSPGAVAAGAPPAGPGPPAGADVI